MIYNKLFKIFLVFTLFFCPMGAIAENIDPDNSNSQYAYSENMGWLNAEPDGGVGVQVMDKKLTGYIWAENIGWIFLSPKDYGGVANDGCGRLSGYAWSENVGWINFNPSHGGVLIDANTGVFSGYAWGENVGWISFASAHHSMITTWRKFPWVLFGPAFIKQK